MRITTVTLNPCIDFFVSIPSFTHGGMNRVSGTRRYACGKGINVSVALKNLGVESHCTGFNYVGNGAFIDSFLDEKGVAHHFVYAEGAVRTNIKLVEEDTRVMTEVNQPGEFIPPEKISELADKLRGGGEDVLIISGSRPQGVGADIYEALTQNWNGLVFLDMEGEAFLNAVKAKRPPYLVKPNLYELETAFNVKLGGLPTASLHEAVKNLCQKELCGRGVEAACVSMGGDGAMLVTKKEAVYAPALDIPVRGLTGAGDAMVAGFAYGMLGGMQYAFRCAVAAASASVIRDGTQMCLKADFEEMLRRV